MKEDFKAALERHKDLHQVLQIVRELQNAESPACLPDGQLKRLAERNVLDSIEYFLPMSDSVFILSGEPNVVIGQLSTLLSKIFLFSGDSFTTPDCPDVLNKRIVNIGRNKDGEVDKSDRWEKWYPVLFRGGISYGEAEIVKTSAIHCGNEVEATNIVGEAVVQAVDLEQMRLPGPRLICDCKFADQLCGSVTKYLRREGKVWEVLWPGFNYLEDDDERSQSYVLDWLFEPALALWNHFCGKSPEKHYRAFLELIVRSHLAFAKSTSDPDLVNEFLDQRLDESGLRLDDSVTNSQLVFPRVGNGE